MTLEIKDKCNYLQVPGRLGIKQGWNNLANQFKSPNGVPQQSLAILPLP